MQALTPTDRTPSSRHPAPSAHGCVLHNQECTIRGRTGHSLAPTRVYNSACRTKPCDGADGDLERRSGPPDVGLGRSQDWLLVVGAFGGQSSRWYRCSLRRLCAAQASSHSFSQAARPRRDIMVSFWQVLSCPNTGSTVRARSL